MQLHIDLTVSNSDEMQENYRRAIELGATLLMDRTDDPTEPLYRSGRAPVLPVRWMSAPRPVELSLLEVT